MLYQSYSYLLKTVYYFLVDCKDCKTYKIFAEKKLKNYKLRKDKDD